MSEPASLQKLSKERLDAMDRQADAVIRHYTVGGFAVNLLPPPFDKAGLVAAFVGMGLRLAKVYEVEISKKELWPLAKDMAKGVKVAATGTAGAAFLGSFAFNYIPGVGLLAALLVQPPIIAAIAYSVGHAYKTYYHVLRVEGRRMSSGEMQKLVVHELSERFSVLAGKLKATQRHAA